MALASTAGRLEAVIADRRRAVRLDVETGRPAGPLLGGRDDRVHAVGVATVAGRTIAASATYDTATVRTWDIPDCVPARHPETGNQLVKKDIETVRGLVVTRMGDRAVVVCAGWGDIHVWDAATGGPVGPGVITGLNNIMSVATGEVDGRPIVACACGSSGSQPVMVFDLETGAPLDPPRPRSGLGPEVVAIAGHRGKTLVVSGGSYLSLCAGEPGQRFLQQPVIDHVGFRDPRERLRPVHGLRQFGRQQGEEPLVVDPPGGQRVVQRALSASVLVANPNRRSSRTPPVVGIRVL